MDGLHHFGKTGLYIISASKSRFLAQSIYGDVAIRAEINAFFFGGGVGSLLQLHKSV